MTRSRKIKNWFRLLPIEVRKKAVANTSKEDAEQMAESLSTAIMRAFTWNESPEKHEYWADVFIAIRNQEIEEEKS